MEELRPISPKDVSSLSEKLEKLAAELPDQERIVLDWLMARARRCNDQELADAELSAADLEAVAGGADPASSISTQLASSLGLAADEIEERDSIYVMVSWSR